MNRIKKWMEQNPQRILFIKIGLILLGIILLIAFPTLYLVLSGIGIWYFVKKVPDIRKRNLMIGLFVVSIFVVSFQTPTVTKKSSSSQSKTKQTAASTSSIASTNSTRDTSSSIEEAKRVEEERKAKEKAEEERKAKEKAEEERKAREKAEEEKRAKEKAANELQKKGEALVKQLEESQDMSQVKSAKEIVNQIENTDKKTELLDRIASVESFISQKEEEGRIAREAETRAKEQAEQAQKQQQAPTQSFYKNCKEARAAGVTPIYRGQPGYARHLDRDGDGIACE